MPSEARIHWSPLLIEEVSTLALSESLNIGLRCPMAHLNCRSYKAAFEDSSGGIANPPPEGLNLDIECPVDSFVAAGCLSSIKLAQAPSPSKDSISTIRRGDGCGKPLSQVFSFGETIRLIKKLCRRGPIAGAHRTSRVMRLGGIVVEAISVGPQGVGTNGLGQRRRRELSGEVGGQPPPIIALDFVALAIAGTRQQRRGFLVVNEIRTRL